MLLKTIFYQWLLPNEQTFINSFKDNEAKQNAAKVFIKSLSNCDLWLFISCVFLTAVACILYYTWYNNRMEPFGYHYRMRHWGAWMAIALLLSILATYFCCMFTLDKTNLSGTGEFISKFYLVSAIYSLLFFVILSVVWCNLFPTNAYRWFKIK